MKRLLPVLLLLCSCTLYEHEARSKGGNYVRDRIVKVGGTISHQGSDGSSMASDDQTSFRDAAAAVGTLAATAASKATALAQEGTKQTGIRTAAQTEQARIAAEAAKAAAQEETKRLLTIPK